MLRPIWQAAHRLRTRSMPLRHSALLSTQSSDDAQPPTALTRLYLEDGTVLTGKSFGCHTSVDGEVRSLVKCPMTSFVLISNHSSPHLTLLFSRLCLLPE
jgi:hypothetical protein